MTFIGPSSTSQSTGSHKVIVDGDDRLTSKLSQEKGVSLSDGSTKDMKVEYVKLVKRKNDRGEYFAGDRDVLYAVDRSEIPEQDDAIFSTEIADVGEGIMKSLNDTDRLLVLTIKSEEDSKEHPWEVTDLEMNRAFIHFPFNTKEKSREGPSYKERLDKHGRSVGPLKNDAQKFKRMINSRYQEAFFSGKSQVYEGLENILIEMVDTLKTARKPMILVFSNEHTFADKERLQELVDLLKERPHASVHFITGRMPFTPEVNPNDGPEDSRNFPGGMKFLAENTKNVHVHNLGKGEDREAKIASIFDVKQDMNNIIDFRIRRPLSPVRIGDEITYSLEILNRSDRDIPTGTRIFLKANDYFSRSDYYYLTKPLLPNEEILIPIKCRPEVSRSIKDLPKTMTMCIESPREEEDLGNTTSSSSRSTPEEIQMYDELHRAEFYTDIGDYIADFFDPSTAFKVILQVFGIKGSGKSSFIASLFTLLHGSGKYVCPQGVDIAADNCDVTKKIVRVKFKNDRLDKETNTENKLEVIDVPGTDLKTESTSSNGENGNERWSRKKLKYLSHGLLPSGFALQPDMTGFAPMNIENNGPITRAYIEDIRVKMQEQRPHVFIFCLSHEDIGEDTSCEKIREILGYIRDEGLRVIVNITKADIGVKKLAENPFHDLEEARKKPATERSNDETLVLNLIKKCADKLGVTEADIIYSVSYGGANVDRTFEYDKLIFHNLEKLQTVATEYAKSLEELYPEDGISNEAFATMRIFQNEFN